MRILKMGAFACALALAAPPARGEPIRLGPRAGLTTAWLSEENNPVFGVTAGLLALIPIAKGCVIFEPGLAFSMKGGGWSAGEGGEDIHYDYIEVPLILRYGPPPGFFAGIGIAPAVVVHEWRVSHGGVSYSEARPFDLSVVGDLGADWQHFRFDLLMEVGLVEADRINSAAPPTSKTRALSFLVAWLL
jgi:hypothetical protein